jgi:hypothetical protein
VCVCGGRRLRGGDKECLCARQIMLCYPLV